MKQQRAFLVIQTQFTACRRHIFSHIRASLRKKGKGKTRMGRGGGVWGAQEPYKTLPTTFFLSFPPFFMSLLSSFIFLPISSSLQPRGGPTVRRGWHQYYVRLISADPPNCLWEESSLQWIFGCVLFTRYLPLLLHFNCHWILVPEFIQKCSSIDEIWCLTCFYAGWSLAVV